MKRIGIISIFFLLAISLLAQKVQLERVDQWKLDHNPIAFIGNTYISKDNSIIGLFRDVWGVEITKKEIKQFAGYGEAPNEVILPTILFSYGDDIAIAELVGRVKIFTKKENSYTFKKSIWLKKGELPLSPRSGVFCDGKLFVAGVHFLKYTKGNYYSSLITVFDEKGKQVKTLLEKDLTLDKQYHEFLVFIVKLKNDRLAFLQENEPIVTLISPKSMNVVKQVPLQLPSFYKKMPGDFYSKKSTVKFGDSAYYLKMLETFRTGYSRINNLYFDQDRLILQMRTCDKKLKRYAILVYNADTFKLEHTLYTDDYLVGVKDGKFYCFANGNPGWDGDIDDVVFNIYKIKK